MTRLKKTITACGLEGVEINGRIHFLDNIKEIKPSFYDGIKLNSEWIVCLGDEPREQYRVNGYRNQWLLYCDANQDWKAMLFTSLTACLKSLDATR